MATNNTKRGRLPRIGSQDRSTIALSCIIIALVVYILSGKADAFGGVVSVVSRHRYSIPFFILLAVTSIAIVWLPTAILRLRWEWTGWFPLGLVIGLTLTGIRDLRKQATSTRHIEESENKRLTQLLVRYHEQNAIRVSLRLDAIGTELISVATLRFVLPEMELPAVSIAKDEEFDLFDCWVDWPPTERIAKIEENRANGFPWRLPLAVTEIGGSSDFQIFVRAHNEYKGEGGFTRISAKRIKDAEESNDLEIRLLISNCSIFIPGVHTIDRKRISLSVRSLMNEESSPKFLAHIDRPRAFRLLWRNDNSEYMSLSTDADKEHTRYYLFFPERGSENSKVSRNSIYADMRIRMTMFSSEYSAITEPAFPLFNAGLGLIVSGLAIHILGQGREAPFFALVSTALTLTLWFADGIRRRKVYVPSASLPGFSLNGLALLGSGAVFLVYFCLFAVTYDFYSPPRTATPLNSPSSTATAISITPRAQDQAAVAGATAASGLQDKKSEVIRVPDSDTQARSNDKSRVLGMGGIWGGVILMSLAIRYLLAVQLGRVQGYRCDSCEEPFMSRQKVVVEQPETRKVICPSCATKQRQSEASTVA